MSFKIILNDVGLGNIIRPKFYYTRQRPDEPLYKSELTGKPVFSDLYIYNPDNEQEFFREATVLFEVSRVFNIVKTPTQGRTGTVKEFISADDYYIRINGRITSGVADRAPKEKKQELANILNLGKALAINSSFLNDFSIYNIVIESYDVKEIQGMRDTYQFSIRAVSDEPSEIVIGKRLSN